MPQKSIPYHHSHHDLSYVLSGIDAVHHQSVKEWLDDQIRIFYADLKKYFTDYPDRNKSMFDLDKVVYLDPKRNHLYELYKGAENFDDLKVHAYFRAQGLRIATKTEYIQLAVKYGNDGEDIRFEYINNDKILLKAESEEDLDEDYEMTFAEFNKDYIGHWDNFVVQFEVWHHIYENGDNPEDFLN